VVAHLRRLRRRRQLLVRLQPKPMLVVEVLVEGRPRPPAAEARLRLPRVVARLRRRQLRRRLLVRLRQVHMLAVEVLVERRPQAPAAEAGLRPPREVARLRRCRRRLLLRLRPVHMLAVEALLGPRVLRWVRRRWLLRSLLPPGQQKLGLLLHRCSVRPSTEH
jgi:hypothetical protein